MTMCNCNQGRMACTCKPAGFTEGNEWERARGLSIRPAEGEAHSADRILFTPGETKLIQLPKNHTVICLDIRSTQPGTSVVSEWVRLQLNVPNCAEHDTAIDLGDAGVYVPVRLNLDGESFDISSTELLQLLRSRTQGSGDDNV